MKNFKYLILILLIIVLNINANAATCELSEITRLRTYAKEIDFSYDYDVKTTKDENGDSDFYEANFTLTAINLNSEIMVIYDVENFINYKYKTIKYDSSGVNTIKNLSSGQKLTFQLRAYVDNACAGELLTTKTVTLPYYNHRYNGDECKNYPEFKYCTELLDKNISDIVFYQELEKYKDSLVVEKEKNDDDLKTFIQKYLLFIIFGFIGLIGIIVLIVASIKRKKKYEL